MTTTARVGSGLSPNVTPAKVLAMRCAMANWPGLERKPGVPAITRSKAANA